MIDVPNTTNGWDTRWRKGKKSPKSKTGYTENKRIREQEGKPSPPGNLFGVWMVNDLLLTWGLDWDSRKLGTDLGRSSCTCVYLSFLGFAWLIAVMGFLWASISVRLPWVLEKKLRLELLEALHLIKKNYAWNMSEHPTDGIPTGNR